LLQRKIYAHVLNNAYNICLSQLSSSSYNKEDILSVQIS